MSEKTSRKKSSEKEVRVSSKSEERRMEIQKSAQPESVKKYRMTFIMGRPFQGKYYKQQESIEVDEHIFKAYRHRTKEFSFVQI